MKTKSKLLRNEKYWAYVFLLPAVVLFFIFVFIPAITSVFMSFTNYSLFAPSKWVGLENYKYAITNSICRAALFNTLYFVISTIIIGMTLSLLLANLLNQPFKGRAIPRVLIYLPVVTPILAISFLWRFIYDSTPGGLLNYLLGFFGVFSQEWLHDVKLAMPAVIIMSIWKRVGYNMIIFLAGLQGIPGHLYEAADLDGASRIKKLLYITIPLLKPVTLFVFITSTINAFQVFSQIYAMTEGGPVNSTITLAYLVYTKGFRQFRLGLASAEGVLLAMIMFIFSAFYIRKILRES